MNTTVCKVSVGPKVAQAILSQAFTHLADKVMAKPQFIAFHKKLVVFVKPLFFYILNENALGVARKSLI
jgi:hypothetical protein